MEITVNHPVTIGSLELRNRLLMAPMQQYKGTREAFAVDHHTAFYGRRAQHVGLIILESTSVSPNGRLWPNDIGIFSDLHAESLRKITDAVHAQGTPVFVQLSHGGRKSHPEVTQSLIAPSAIPYDDEYGMPEALSHAGIANVVEEYRQAARKSVEAGFDGIEIHAAHGFLIHQFMSPLSNKRTDEYGGSAANRARFLHEVLSAIREQVGRDYPVIVRISATDYAEGGLTPRSWAEMLKPMETQLDAVHVSSGGLVPVKPSDVYSAYQVPHAAAVKQHLDIPVIAVGLVHSRSLANRILQDRLADAVAVGRPMLDDPDFAASMLESDTD